MEEKEAQKGEPVECWELILILTGPTFYFLMVILQISNTVVFLNRNLCRII